MRSFPVSDFRFPIAGNRLRSRRAGLPAAAGFTLVEVLAALTVILIALPVAMEAISLTEATATRARRQLEAANLAGSKLAELVATNAWQNGNGSGDFSNYSTSFPDYTWTSTVTQYEQVTTGTTAAVTTPSGTTLGGTGAPGSAAPGSSMPGVTLGSSSTSVGSTLGGQTALPVTLEELDVTVSWPERNQTFSVTLSTLIYPGLGST
jgi:prepilin-type N-terminal cleavage/methylation domain-containing protein